MTTRQADQVAAAWEVVRTTRQKLADRSATSADHMPVLEALLDLPDDTADRLIDEFRNAFAFVYAREREQRKKSRAMSREERS